LLGNVFSRIAALPLAAKVLLVLGTLVALGLSIVLSPFVVVLAFLVLHHSYRRYERRADVNRAA
jgi:hypothetical protein